MGWAGDRLSKVFRFVIIKTVKGDLTWHVSLKPDREWLHAEHWIILVALRRRRDCVRAQPMVPRLVKYSNQQCMTIPYLTSATTKFLTLHCVDHDHRLLSESVKRHAVEVRADI